MLSSARCGLRKQFRLAMALRACGRDNRYTEALGSLCVVFTIDLGRDTLPGSRALSALAIEIAG